MQITHVGSAQVDARFDAAFADVSRPAGVQSGDLLVLTATLGNGAAYGVSAAPPDGSWTQLFDEGQSGTRFYVWYKFAGTSEPASYRVYGYDNQGDSRPGLMAGISVYRGADSVDPFDGSAVTYDTYTTPSVSSDTDNALILQWWVTSDTNGSTAPTGPSPVVTRVDLPGGAEQDNDGFWQHWYSKFSQGDVVQANSGPSGSHTSSYSWTGTERYAVAAALRSANVAPNAPTLSGPDGVTIDREQANVFSWTFSDPDPGDSQTAYDLRYRIVGAATWTTLNGATPTQSRQIAANTFAEGDYEWQVRTYDERSAVGPWSASAFFTAATVPKDVSIVSPVNGGTIGTESFAVEWSTTSQEAYQVRTVADLAGSPDTATIYYDSGVTVSTTARSLLVPFAVNSRYEHVQVRVQRDSLWGEWVSVRAYVSYVPPALPVVTLAALDASASLSVAISNPAPTGDEPAVVWNEIFVDEGDGERKAAQVGANATWTYYVPRPNYDFDGKVRVVAVGETGTSTST